MYRGYQIRTQYTEAFEIVKIKDDTNLFADAKEVAPSRTIEKRFELAA